MTKDFWADAMKFNTSSVGFDKVASDLQELTSRAMTTKYPPYNIKKVSEGKYVIEMAIAGFSEQQIEIATNGDELVIAGQVDAQTSNASAEYLHKGIASRNFNHVFKLADSVTVKNAEMINGMLSVWLDAMSEASKVVRIPINSPKAEPQTAETEKAAMAKM